MIYQMYPPFDLEKPLTWSNLAKFPYTMRKNWIQRNINEIIQVLSMLPMEDEEQSENPRNHWNIIGFICINDNLYKEAEAIYESYFKRIKSGHGNISVPAYYRGICKFLQGRYKDADEDFKLARLHDLQTKKFNSPAVRAHSYMEETIFPTKQTIQDNQQKLIKDLNQPRMLEKVIGSNMLKTLHKWNSSSPLFSRGVSQGGGYYLTLQNPHGQLKGIAIDPGYDFYYIFRDLGLGITDIDAIIITHDHDDHTESVEGILSLLAKYNDHNPQKKSHVIDIFGSAGALLKFHGLLSATDLFGNKEINFKLLVPGNTIHEIEGASLWDKYGITLHIKQAFHSERWTTQESAVGLIIETSLQFNDSQPLCIGITGDTRYEDGIGREYQNAQLILINIGSIEKEEGQLLHQHLGVCGCINLLKEARLGKPLLAILTEFGEEFNGRRGVISGIIENWAHPLDNIRNSHMRVIPADVHLEVRLKDLNIRESDTNIFFPYQNIRIDENNPEILKYRFNKV